MSTIKPVIYGPNGKPLDLKKVENKKVAPPRTGEKYGHWGGEDIQYFQLPGGSIMQFDLSQLQLSDYRQMLDHYQINSSLTVLTFLLHQLEWKIEGGTAQQNAFYTEQLENNWTMLVRSLSTAFWSGFSPNVLQWENDTPARRITLTKVKDLIPEECFVQWKKVDGADTEKISIYDGIRQITRTKPIPVENTLWYPLLSKNGDLYGQKLLRSAFQPWFFSQLVHLFANRYYERFGEPTPIGRAPYDDEVKVDGTYMRGNQAMEIFLRNLRSGGAVVLPSDKTQYGDETTLDPDYQIQYLESQMRGADFERYMTRLDEEMSLALFTPILLMRTADVGSYNLGTQHSIIYQWMLNALSGDWKYYIDWYLLRPLRDYNWGTSAELPRIKFHKMGRQNLDVINNIVNALISSGKAKPSYDELGEMAGMTLTEVKEVTEPDDGNDPEPPSSGSKPAENRQGIRGVVDSLRERIHGQVVNAFRRGEVATSIFSLGHQRQFEDELGRIIGESHAAVRAREYYEDVNVTLMNLTKMEFKDVETFMDTLDQGLEYHLRMATEGRL
jgi:hypothetical protein